MGVSTPRLWSLSLSPSSAASSRRSSASARTSPSDAASTRPSATEMYVALREMERDAEEAELKCVTNAGSSSEAQQCTADFVEASDDIELARLGAKASGTDTQEERVIARAAVKRARQQRAASVSEVGYPLGSSSRSDPHTFPRTRQTKKARVCANVVF